MSNCDVLTLKELPTSDLRLESPDGKKYLVNKADEYGIFQIYVGDVGSDQMTCISNQFRWGAPLPWKMKMQANWHPNSRWITCAVERDTYTVSPLLFWNRDYIVASLQTGLWTDMYAVSPNGVKWVKMTSFASNTPGVGDGFTGPAMTPDGKHGVWSQAMGGNIFQYYPFGQWQLTMGDWIEGTDGIPKWQNIRDITPPGMNWNEPGNFCPTDPNVLVMTGSFNNADQEGMDQYLLNVSTKSLTNLTNSPYWDEHGVFSPDGKKILFMSSFPYKDPASSTWLSIKTEFMLMNKDGSGLQQLTSFTDTGIAAIGAWSKDGTKVTLLQMQVTKYKAWELVFAGPCGKS